MAETSGPNAFEIPGWRLGIIIAIFILISYLYVFLVKTLERYLKRKGRQGLVDALHHINTEIMLIGLISLLLVQYEGYLLRICIPCSENDLECKWDCNRDDLYSNVSAIMRELEATNKENITIQEESDKARVEEFCACAIAKENCPAGSEPFYSGTSITQGHYILFYVGVIHLLYTIVVSCVCLLTLQTWKKFEQRARQSEQLTELETKYLPKLSESRGLYWTKTFFFAFTYRVRYPYYAAIRRLFLERLELQEDYNFYSFVEEQAEKSFAEMIEVGFTLWVVLLLWVMVPTVVHLRVWLVALALVLTIFVAIKMQDVVTQITLDAVQTYGHRDYAVVAKKKGISRGLVHLVQEETSDCEVVSDVVIDFAQKHLEPKLDSEAAVNTPSVLKGALEEEQTASLEVAATHESSQAVLSRSTTFSESYKCRDSALLFWFKKPAFTMAVARFCCFTTSTGLAVIVFASTANVMEDIYEDWYISLGVSLASSCIIILLLSMVIIPKYALTTAAGSHAAHSSLKLALKRNEALKLVAHQAAK